MATSRPPAGREGGRANEWSLLLSACRDPGVELPTQVAALSPGARAGDWAGVLSLMDEHGVGPLAASALLSVGDGLVPADVRAALQERVQVGALRARILVQELLCLVEALEARGVAAAAYKGPALSVQAHGSPGVRDSTDLDLMVRNADVPAALQVLQERGYRRHNPPPLGPRQEAAWRATWNEYELLSHDGLLFMDLHWRPCPSLYPFRVDERRLWARPAGVVLGGRTVRVFPEETMLVLLCLHGAKDRWRKLIWLCDVDRLIRAHPSLDWDEVRALARESRCARALDLGLLLAQDLLGTPLPPAALSWLGRSRAAADLAARVAEHLAAGGIQRSWRWELFDVWPFHLEVFDSRADGASYLFRTLVTPVVWDWQRVRLPDLLYPLHHLARPLRLLAALARRSVVGGRRPGR